MKNFNTIMLSVFIITGCYFINTENDNPEPYTSFNKNQCVVAGAAYDVYYTEINGNCGKIPNTFEYVSETGEFELLDGCNKAPRYDANDSCDIYLDVICKSNDLLKKQYGRVIFSDDGIDANGKITIEIKTKDSYCLSTYDAHYIILRSDM